MAVPAIVWSAWKEMQAMAWITPKSAPASPAPKEGQPAVSGFQAEHGAGKGAYGHHSFNTDINYAAAFRKTGTKSRQKKRRRGNQRSVDQKAEIFNEYIHINLPPSSL